MTNMNSGLYHFLNQLPQSTNDKIDVYKSLYNESGEFKDAFTYFHAEFDTLFDFMNYKFATNGHYNAHQSRILFDLIEKLEEFKSLLSDNKNNLEIKDGYKNAIEHACSFLCLAGGSTIPENYQKVNIDRYRPIFSIEKVNIEFKYHKPKLIVVGAGSYSIVYKFLDYFTKHYIALKKAKKDLNLKEIERFSQEYKLLKKCSHPNVLEVYEFFRDYNSFTMEFCDCTLEGFFQSRNSTLEPSQRIVLVRQFLSALNHLQFHGILHRDLSAKNILIKVYNNDYFQIKLADFGLAKSENSMISSSNSEIKGHIIDLNLENFKDFNLSNEIYAVGHIINYIWTGKSSIQHDSPIFPDVVDPCISSNINRRPKNIPEVFDLFKKFLR